MKVAKKREEMMANDLNIFFVHFGCVRMTNVAEHENFWVDGNSKDVNKNCPSSIVLPAKNR
jgi:hypothetical protein